MLDELTRADFEKALHTKFTVVEDGREVGYFVLVAIEKSSYPTIPGREATGRPFSLMLHGRHSNALPQRTYDFRSEVLGDLTFFIVPIAQDAQGVTYEAVFN